MELREEATVFFDAFVAAFATFDGARIAARYAIPFVALNGDGTTRCFVEATAIAAYFQDVVDTYRADGCHACRYRGLEVAPLGTRSALATVTWELLRADASVVSVWRESYNLMRHHGGWRIFASVDHVA